MRNRFGHTALHAAVHGGHVRVTRGLLEFGANPNLRFDGICALDMAKELNDVRMLRILSDACIKWESEHRNPGEDEEGVQHSTEVKEKQQVRRGTSSKYARMSK